MEVIEGSRYLGVHLDNRLDRICNTEAAYRKGQGKPYFLRKLRSFDVCSKMLHIFYQSVVASAIVFAAICWGSSIRTSNSEKLNNLTKEVGSVLGLLWGPLS